jgi:hypothetical protein
MKMEKYSANRTAQLAKRLFLALAIIGVAATSSGCLVVRDDQGHHHWRWHHEDNDVDHHDHN